MTWSKICPTSRYILLVITDTIGIGTRLPAGAFCGSGRLPNQVDPEGSGSTAEIRNLSCGPWVWSYWDQKRTGLINWTISLGIRDVSPKSILKPTSHVRISRAWHVRDNSNPKKFFFLSSSWNFVKYGLLGARMTGKFKDYTGASAVYRCWSCWLF